MQPCTMRIQTWAVRVQFQSDGELHWDLVHSTYTARGRQVPRQLAAGYVARPSELPRLFDQLADMVSQSYALDDGSVQLPLPL